MVTQRATLTYGGSASEFTVALNRGINQCVKKIDIIWPNIANGDFVVISRKNSATTADERDSSKADSKGVWIADGFMDTGSLSIETSDGFRNSQLRIYVSAANAGTIYLNVNYDVG